MRNLILCLLLLSSSVFGQSEKVHLVSLINLIATPEKFDGKVVAVKGDLYFNYNSPYPIFWLSLTDQKFDPMSMVNLKIPLEYIDLFSDAHGKFYDVVGVFSNCSAPIVDGKACYLSITPNRVGPDQLLDMRTYD